MLQFTELPSQGLTSHRLSDQAPLTEGSGIRQQTENIFIIPESSAGLAGLAPLPLDLSNLGETVLSYPRGHATGHHAFPSLLCCDPVRAVICENTGLSPNTIPLNKGSRIFLFQTQLFKKEKNPVASLSYTRHSLPSPHWARSLPGQCSCPHPPWPPSPLSQGKLPGAGQWGTKSWQGGDHLTTDLKLTALARSQPLSKDLSQISSSRPAPKDGIQDCAGGSGPQLHHAHMAC